MFDRLTSGLIRAVERRSKMECGARTVPEFMAWAGIKRTTFYEEVKAGRLKIVKVGSRTLIRDADGKIWLAGLSETPTNRSIRKENPAHPRIGAEQE